MSNSVIKRKYYAIEIVLVSPLSVSGGLKEYTDSDVLRNGNGEVFVPGTSLAGAFRNYLDLDKNEDGIFGFAKGKNGKMSSVYVSDLYFSERPSVTVRDGVELDEGKSVKNKFDMEIVETGLHGIFYLSYVVREKSADIDYESAIVSILQAIANGEIRFGGNKNRGFGRMAVSKIFQQEFKKDEVDDWIKFCSHVKDVGKYSLEEGFEEWSLRQKTPQQKYIKIQVPLRLTGGISIRKYSAQSQKANFEHITCNKKPVIPGSSWNGAIRANAASILRELGCTDVKEKLDRWFGYVGKTEKKGSEQSLIVVGESIIEGGKALPITRNKINRFSAAVKEEALYSEVAYFGGKTILELMIRKDEDKEYFALIGILMMVISNIQNGYTAIGGQVAVGRGIFSEDESYKIQYSEPIAKETCMSALYSLL